MNIKDYQSFVSEGVAQRETRGTRPMDLQTFLLEFVGEVGEMMNTIKHVVLWNKEEAKDNVTMEDVCEELGDVLWYYTAICERLGLSIEGIMIQNQIKLNARYGVVEEEDVHCEN